MPNVAARRCILDIHTQKWSPHPDDNLLNELAAACTGYCGADIKALCTEAALHAVQRAYPQIWQSDQKLLINHESIVVTRTDFMRAKKKVVPSLLRSSTSYGKPLLGLLKPILSPVVTETVRALQSAFFPFCESVASFRSAGETEFDDIQLDTAGRPPPAWSCVHIHGPADCGQADIAVAVLRHFDQVPCQGLDLPALIANNNSRSLEEAAVTTARQAGQMTPSILYLPHFQVLMRTAYEGVRTALWCALERLPSSVLLLVTSDVPLERLPPGAEPFLAHHGVGQSFEVKVDPPKDDARRVAFTESFNALNTFVAIPVDTSGTLPVLPVAPIVHDPCADALKEAQLMYNAEKYVSAAKVLRSALAYHDKDASLAQALKIAEANIKNQRDHARKVLLDLRFEIRDILESIEKQRRFKMFMHPVDPDIAPDYYALVETPVDVEMIRAKNDDGHYSDTQSFFADIEMILRNAKAYNSSSSEQGAEIIARAHAFVDFVERRLDNSDAVKLAKEYHRLQECGVGLASAHEPSIDRGQFHNARSGRGDDRQRPVRRPYQAPGGARASRRVAGAAPEVVLSFAEMGTKPEVLANQGTSDSLDVEHNKDAARETVLQHGRVQDIATQSQAVDRPTSSSVDATVAMSDQASIDNASVLGDHAADVEWVAPGQVVQDLTERFTTNSCGLNLKQLLHICARVSSVVWKHRHSTDKRSAVQELELICKELGKIVQTTHNQ
jgi:SpoVK/Ycf46/Vps4 family AAA+-type ATPase